MTAPAGCIVCSYCGRSASMRLDGESWACYLCGVTARHLRTFVSSEAGRALVLDLLRLPAPKGVEDGHER